MKRKIYAVMMVFVLSWCMAVPIWADAAVDWYPEEQAVDYYVLVSAPDGGVNLRYGPGVEYDRLMDYMIPNDVYLHVTQSAQASNGNYWGYTEYQGMYGWIALTQVTTIEGVPPTVTPVPTETPMTTATPEPTQTATETPQATETATPTATDIQTPAATETAAPTATVTSAPKEEGITISYSLLTKLLAIICIVLIVALLALFILLKKKK